MAAPKRTESLQATRLSGRGVDGEGRDEAGASNETAGPGWVAALETLQAALYARRGQR